MSAPIVNSCVNSMKSILIHFAHEHVDFRLAELASILKLFKITTCLPDQNGFSPFLKLDLPSLDCAQQIASRAVLIKSVYELWAQGKTHKELNESLSKLPAKFLDPYITSGDTYKFQVTSFNKKIPPKRKLEIIENLPHEVLAFEGRVDLKNHQHAYHIIEDYGSTMGKPTKEPEQVFFAKWIADGQRDKINEFHLQKRHFIANTSMDAALSMIMANLAKVGPNMVVLDPFVGSGSLLVSAAAKGAYVMGTDIDYLLLHAKSRPSRCNMKKRQSDESVYSNLHQYGLEKHFLNVLVADASKPHMWREQTFYDAIITDPPYGIREGAKKIDFNPTLSLTDEQRNGGTHIAQRTEYHLSDIFRDLLNFAARYLHVNGRLVYWFPVQLHTYAEGNIPSHPCLRLVHNCEQKLNSKVGRRLITMEKVCEFNDDMQDAKLAVDHFQEASFRDMYFSESSVLKEKLTQARSRPLKSAPQNDLEVNKRPQNDLELNKQPQNDLELCKQPQNDLVESRRDFSEDGVNDKLSQLNLK
ncbi:tRNA (guanine(10)-N2)-methyltransferase homolog [Dreissena polymorpha]|uniref:tRNA (guanine(10)-N2)-methyltransferase homolog n=1 Tax=Dreissena polymorpha TaxID=45954 RepID=UPI0022645E08|nr:tRNA (guanine(10)-N2)-methyltransferase homolog [Dreissena polymorpha]